MTVTYAGELSKKAFTGNAVIRFLGKYFCIRQPDSGLVVDAAYIGSVAGLSLTPTVIDLKRVNTSIQNYGFKIQDNGLIVTQLVKENAQALIGVDVDVWLGRSGVSLDFANYFRLPTVKIKKVDHVENAYNFSAVDATDRMNVTFFSTTDTLGADIIDSTTVIQMPLTSDLSVWGSSGLFRLEDEFISYAAVDNTLKRFTGCLRGLFGSTAVAHSLGTSLFRTLHVVDHPLNILLSLIISKGGGGAYDTYYDGLGIDNTLIDIAGIEFLRDNIFVGRVFELFIYDIPNALRFIETELLQPNNLRIATSADSKITTAILDQAVFANTAQVINEDTITKYPKWAVDGNKIVNQLQIDWDYDEVSKNYLKTTLKSDAQSITDFGALPLYSMQFKGVVSAHGGQSIVNDLAARFLSRFATPTPEIEIETQIDKSLYVVGSKVLTTSKQMPSIAGNLNFSTELEVYSQAVNPLTGDVKFKLIFTSYSGVRKCYIAPSDKLQTAPNQHTITVPAGRGAIYQVGWQMKLWNDATHSYYADPVNKIASVVGDTITFENDWATTLMPGTQRLKFPDYDNAALDQTRYCFISHLGADFPDMSSTYRISF